MTVSDLQADSMVNPSCCKVCIKCSKTDPFCLGCDDYLGHRLGSMCPITALDSYLSLCSSVPGPLFMSSDGCPLTQQQFSSSVQSILNEARYSGSYSGHTFCNGVATTAAAPWVPDHLIQVLCHWKSDAYKQYIRTPPDLITRTAKSLVDTAWNFEFTDP